MAKVTIRGATKRYGAVVALEPLDLDIEEGEFLTLLGPSGCGKTTTLRLVAGFIEPDAGRILIDGQDVTRLPPQKRQIGMVFQDYALFPHLTVAENIGFGLVERGAPRGGIAARVAELLELIRLPGVGDRYPGELSGGQRQRVAVARAVAYPPRVLLMDEPLGALDLKLREAMQLDLRALQRELGITTVYVTHDQTEAMTMSDRIAVMDQGRVVQLDLPREVYLRPRSRFVASFVGKANLLDGRLEARDDGGLTVICAGGSPLKCPWPNGGPVDGPVTLAVRPEHMTVVPADGGSPPSGLNELAGTVVEVSFVGNLTAVFVAPASARPIVVECGADDYVPELGEAVRVVWQPDRTVVLRE